ncbi:MAG: ribonuclease H-like domain-containing protein [Terriglobales bacterium]
MWWAWRNDGDQEARERLIAYNRCDVMNLIPLLAEVHGRLARERVGSRAVGAGACG